VATFNPEHTYIIWPDYTGIGGHTVLADAFQVTQGGALIFSARGEDGDMHVTRVVSPQSYAHMILVEAASLHARDTKPLA
jgi:hypothetical protein